MATKPLTEPTTQTEVAGTQTTKDESLILCPRSQPFANSDSVNTVVGMLNDRAYAHLQSIGADAEALKSSKSGAELLSNFQQLIKDPLGRYTWGYQQIANCLDIRFVTTAQLAPSKSVQVFLNDVPQKATILVDKTYESDPSIASLLLSDAISQVISWYQVPKDEHRNTGQCLTDKAHGLAAQLSYLVVSLQEPNETQLPERILATSKTNEELNQLNLAFIAILAKPNSEPNYNFYEYRDLAEQYVGETPYYKSQCPVTTSS